MTPTINATSPPASAPIAMAEDFESGEAELLASYAPIGAQIGRNPRITQI